MRTTVGAANPRACPRTVVRVRGVESRRGEGVSWRVRERGGTERERVCVRVREGHRETQSRSREPTPLPSFRLCASAPLALIICRTAPTSVLNFVIIEAHNPNAQEEGVEGGNMAH